MNTDETCEKSDVEMSPCASSKKASDISEMTVKKSMMRVISKIELNEEFDNDPSAFHQLSGNVLSIFVQ